MPTLDEGARDPGPPHGLRRISQSRRQNGFGVERDAVRRQPVDHLAHATDSSLALFGEKRQERRSVGLHEVSEHVDVGAFRDGRDFDARNKRDLRASAGVGCRRASGNRVVVGDGENPDAGGRGTRHQFLWRTPTVRGRGVGVEIDQRVLHAPARASGAGEPPAARGAPDIPR